MSSSTRGEAMLKTPLAAQAFDNQWRNGSVSNPFCHLVIRAIRRDSHPLAGNRKPLFQSPGSNEKNDRPLAGPVEADYLKTHPMLLSQPLAFSAGGAKAGQFWSYISRPLPGSISRSLQQRVEPDRSGTLSRRADRNISRPCPARIPLIMRMILFQDTGQ